MKAIIIEDNPEVAEAVSVCLQLRWPDINIGLALDGSKGLELSKSEYVDIVVLDLNLPDIDGLDILRQIRSFSDVPIVILTVRGMEDDIAKGLETGADDYIVKPFKARDLVARVNAVLRRVRSAKTKTNTPSYVQGNLKLDLATGQVILGEKVITLTRAESRVLYTLMKNAEHTVANKQILEEVWGKEYMNSDVLRTQVRRIRDKLGDRPAKIIVNQRGEGYRFVTPT